ncbi:hypothetical protein FH972_021550 [Carpinus fangiana]|uniref:Helicase ATP-binding domain-containing protein n=1 Tax=Carpinus fangiana TaxID=176857 RepID=A0A5N6KPM3_9ROSI|nr:hypothetical protein FH972_021550 [Carpinus fangiana]
MSSNGFSAYAGAAAWDPRALLNPKIAAKKPTSNGTNGTNGVNGNHGNAIPAGPSQPSLTHRSSSNGSGNGNQTSSMLERLHNVQDRQDQPRKRLKVDSNQEDDDEVEVQKKAQHSSRGGGGDLGKYVEEKRKQGLRDNPQAAIVDLTSEKYEDDFVVTRDNSDTEVCLGRIDGARVMAHRIPVPKMLGATTTKTWQSMKTELVRRPGVNTMIIGCCDTSGKDFGSIDVRTASVLAPLMDSVRTSKVRLTARLDVRPRKPYEVPGLPVSDSYSIAINVYAPRKMVTGIGRLFSQKQVWLRDPYMVDRNIPLVNPHAPQDHTPKHLKSQGASTTSRYVGGGSSVTRTQEEIKRDVTRIFDSIKGVGEPPVMDQPGTIKTQLLPHQSQALYFMTHREMDDSDIAVEGETKDENSLWQEQIRDSGRRSWYNVITGMVAREKPEAARGGILADVMGLGKTLNVLSLTMATMNEAIEFEREDSRKAPVYDDEATTSELKYSTRATLIICPVSTVSNWEEQITRHIRRSAKLKWTIYHGTKRTNEPEELTDYDIVISTYSVCSADANASSRSRPNNPLAEINWFRIVLDEAHLIREQSTRQSKAVCELTGQRRWAVTGTPVQNKLDDLGALLKFLRIRPFDEPGVFARHIISPFKLSDVNVIEKLQVLVNSITLRRLKDKINLPPRHEEIAKLDMSDGERQFYEFFERDSKQKVQAMTSGRQKIAGGTYAHVLRAILRLRLLCAHGADLLSDEDYDLSKGFSSLNAIDLEDEADESSDKTSRQAFEMFRMMRDATVNICSKCNKIVTPREKSDYDLEDDEDEDTFGFLTPCNQLVCPSCMSDFRKELRANAGADGFGFCPICETYIKVETSFELKEGDMEQDEQALRDIRANPRLAKHHGRYGGPHTKTKTLLESLQKDAAWSAAHPEDRPIKSVVFSGWTSHLDLIQIALTDAKMEYCRLDGSMARTARSQALETFATSPTVCVFLISLGAGGLGLNLTTASRVYVMEPQFNPAAEAQAIERVHRLGQTRPVVITKYIMAESFEEKMVELQKKKLALAQMTVSRERMKGSKDEIRTKLDDLKALFK